MGALCSWAIEATRAGRHDIVIEILVATDLSSEIRDNVLSSALHGYLYRAERLQPALQMLRLVSHDWEVSSRAESILRRAVYLLGKAHSPSGRLPNLPLATAEEDRSIWRELCLLLAEWGVSLVDFPTDSARSLEALLKRADELGGKWSKVVRSTVSVQSRLCDLGIELDPIKDEEQGATDRDESEDMAAQSRQDLAWDLARNRPPDEAVAVLETLQGWHLLEQAVRFVCEEFLGRGLVEDALEVIRRYAPGSSSLLRVAQRMRELERGVEEIREVLDELTDPSLRLWGLLEFASCYEVPERDAEVRSLLAQVAEDGYAHLYFAYARLVRAGYVESFWSIVPKELPYQVLASSCAEEGESDPLRDLILRSLEEPQWGWEMVAALVPLYPEQTQELGDFMFSHFLDSRLESKD